MSPDWYPDPSQPGQLRWWDGLQWTGHTHRAPGQLDEPVGPDPARDLADESKWAARASIGLICAALLTLIQYPMSVFLIHDFGRVFHAVMAASRAVPATPVPLPLRVNRALMSAAQLAGLAVLIGQAMFVVWLYKAATISERIGLHLRHRPYWAVLGFFVPIVNLWFPYDVARDLFPAGDPGRRTVKRWWTLYLAGKVAAIPVFIIAFLQSAMAALAVAPLPAVLSIAAAITGRTMITQVHRAHTELIHTPTHC
jgi:hypothetical protein